MDRYESMKVVVTDDHPLVLDGIERVFEREPDLTVVARCHDGAETLRAVRQYRPDILVLDWHLPDLSSFEVLRALNRDRSTTRVVLLTTQIDEDEVFEAFRLGVRGVVLKEMKTHILVQWVRKVYAGGQWLELDLMARALEKMIRSEEARRRVRGGLTSREIEIVAMVASRLRNKEIGCRLHISEGTVKIHLHNIYKKLHVSGRVELSTMALSRAWVKR
jgi:two-component system, NarL family, nitrate/nitrite response regulator NarL